MGTSSPNWALAAAALARMVASSSQCVAMSIGHSLKMPSSTAASSTNMSPVELPMNTLTPQTRLGSVFSTSSRLPLEAPMKKL